MEKGHGKQVDPIQALITRQLKLKGNMAKVLRAVKAAQELVNSATQVRLNSPNSQLAENNTTRAQPFPR